MHINLRRKSKENYDIVCPYCFSKFPSNRVHFRDSRGVQLEKGQEDEKFNNFWRSLSKTPDKVDRFYDPAVDAGEIVYNDIEINGKTYKIVNGFKPKGSPTATYARICPECHNRLPVSSGKSKSTVIAILGSTQIGKTFYINSLITGLKALSDEGFKRKTFQLINEKMEQTYREIKRDIENGTQEATARGYIEPIIGEFTNNDTRENTIISFYDFPGESTISDIAKHSQRQIENADAYLILFDLTRTDTLFSNWIDGLINELKEKQKDFFYALEQQGKGNILETIKDMSYAEFKMMLPFDSAKDYKELLDTIVNIKAIEKEVKSIEKKKKLFGFTEKPQETENDNIANDVFSYSGSGISTGMGSDSGSSIEADKTKKYNLAKDVISKHRERLESVFECDITDDQMNLIYKIMQSKQRIHHLEEDKKHTNSYYDPSIGGYKDLKTAADWLMHIYGEATGNVRTNKPTAIVGTKSDEIFETADRREGFSTDSMIYKYRELLNKDDKELHKKGKYNINEGNSINGFVQQQLLARDGTFLTRVDSSFGNVKYFAVSSLGARYVEEKVYNEKTQEYEIKKVLEASDINSWRVTEPMLWLLYELGRIEGE